MADRCHNTVEIGIIVYENFPPHLKYYCVKKYLNPLRSVYFVFQIFSCQAFNMTPECLEAERPFTNPPKKSILEVLLSPQKKRLAVRVKGIGMLRIRIFSHEHGMEFPAKVVYYRVTITARLPCSASS
jgi:hypothetical protein